MKARSTKNGKALPSRPKKRPAPAPPVKKAVRGHWVSPDELAKVHDRLREAQETLDAIRSGEVDAVVVAGPHGNHVYSLTSVDQPYRVYVERMQEGAVTISAEGLILYCNQRFADMVKLPLEKVIGSRASDHLSKDVVAIISDVIDEGHEPVKRECMLCRAGQEILPVHLSASALPMEDQTVVCLVVTDLTLQRSQEDLRMAKEVAERANLAKDSFLATLSHELRTPLTPALMSLLALEREEDLSDFVLSELAMIRRNIELETRLIDDLLDLTRIANGKLEFTSNGGAITVLTENPRPGQLRLEVRDTGIGFEPEVGNKLFQAFEQSGRGITQQFGGLGLGLTISRSIVEAHGGEIRGHSDGPGTGAVFTVLLPLKKAPTSREARSRTAASRASRGADVLVVEDHSDTRATLERLLARRGHKVTVASTGNDALDAAAAARFDLVISDLGLPDMTGNELMTQLRVRHSLPGIAVSGYGMEADVARSRAAGFVHHLTKPIQIDQLIELIEKIVAS